MKKTLKYTNPRAQQIKPGGGGAKKLHFFVSKRMTP